VIEMTNENRAVVMGRFRDVDRAAGVLDQLREFGIAEEDVEVLSGYPFSAEMLGLQHRKNILPLISLGSAVAGFLVGLFFTSVSPHLYVVRVGGQPIVPIPPTALLQFEFTMIFLILGTFVGFMWLNLFPHLGRQYYDQKISDGEIGLIVHCRDDEKSSVQALLESQEAENVHEPEWRPL
jgi:hypothetical protein